MDVRQNHRSKSSAPTRFLSLFYPFYFLPMQTELSKASIEETRMQIQTVEKKILSLEIMKPDDLDIAKALEKECTAIEKFIETNRTSLTVPIGEIVKNINAQAKELALPITQAKEGIRAKQIAFAQKLEAERLAKERIILDIIQKINTTPDDIELELLSDEITEKDPRIGVAIETRRQFFAEQERLAEFARQQAIEQARLKKIQEEQGIEAARIEKEKANDRLRKQKMEDETKRILEDGKRQEMKEQAEAEMKRQEKVTEASVPKGLRKVVKHEVVAASLVPVEFCTPDDVKIRQALKE